MAEADTRTSFQFPSNGKPYPKTTQSKIPSTSPRVSIPFKRETISKDISSTSVDRADIVSIPFKRETISKVGLPVGFTGSVFMFQFPSNGKPYPKDCLEIAVSRSFCVSIPFKRETISKVNQRMRKYHTRRMQFQFPSNGKPYPKFYQH